MSRFGTIIPWPKKDSRQVNGLRTANESFLRALLKYSDFDDFHLFLNPSQIEDFKNDWQPFLREVGSDKRVLLKSTWELPTCLFQYPYAVFHAGDPYINHLASLREAYASHQYPVTGRTHSLCHDVTLSSFRNILVSPHKAYDSILCSSHAGKTVMENIFRTVRQRTRVEAGIDLVYRGRLDIIPLGIEPEDLPLVSREESRRHLKLPQEATIILCLARISAGDKTDLHPLLLALSELVEGRGCRDLILYVAGTADLGDDYLLGLLSRGKEFVLDKNLLFNLDFDSARKPLIYAAADIFVSLADNPQESFGLAPVEAMHAGLPVVLSDWNGHRELIEDGVHGYLIPTYWDDMDLILSPAAAYQPQEMLFAVAQSVAVDTSQLVERLYMLIRDSELRLRIGQSARERALDQFTWKKVVSLYTGLVASLRNEASPHLGGKPSMRVINMPYYGVFGHYARKRIEERTVLQATQRAKRVYQATESALVYETLSHLIQRDVVFKIIDLTIKPRSFAALVERISVPEILLKYNVLWMLKTDLLKVRDVDESESQAISEVHQAVSEWIEAFRPDQALMRSEPELKIDQDLEMDDAIARRCMDAVSYPEKQRAALFQPIVNKALWKIRKEILAIDGTAEKTLLAGLGTHFALLLDEYVVQAIATYAREELRNNDSYNHILQELIGLGGIRYLAGRYPLWARAIQKDTARFISHFRLFAIRFSRDIESIGCFFEKMPGSERPIPRPQKVTGMKFVGNQPRSILERVLVAQLDNARQLVYKDRDIRIEARILGDTHGTGEGDLSVAEWVNRWLGDPDLVPTCRFLPRADSSRFNRNAHYGYMEYIPHDWPEHHCMTESEAPRFYERLGALSALALILGVSDLHHRNLIVSCGKPYLADLETAFAPQVLNHLEKEIFAPTFEYPASLEGTALEATNLLSAWTSHHSLEYSCTDTEIQGDRLIPKSTLTFQPVTENFIILKGKGTSLDARAGGIHEPYAVHLERGFARTLEACCSQHRVFSRVLDSLGHLPVRYNAVGSVYHLRQIRNQQLYGYYQSLDQDDFEESLRRSAIRLAADTQEARKLFAEKWRDPVRMLAPCFVEDWKENELPEFSRMPADERIYHRYQEVKGNNLESGEHYFSAAPLKVVKRIIASLVEDRGKRERLTKGLAGAYRNWLARHACPVDMPDNVRKAIVSEFEDVIFGGRSCKPLT